jgi:hypothetical protein
MGIQQLVHYVDFLGQDASRPVTFAEVVRKHGGPLRIVIDGDSCLEALVGGPLSGEFFFFPCFYLRDRTQQVSYHPSPLFSFLQLLKLRFLRCDIGREDVTPNSHLFALLCHFGLQ